ncbi:poly-beta-1,6-N-acetyl-D-glucosamine biosynthesis protein PgaD [Candidatus Methylospira mobilis]|uniref:Poly-beta-1,6-N-acetyl-D-glucosamine biosynthesis protein PgaD n=1 Tax=Candidatus Methylospira mobilis TaxID=1808979 RepID=A0A5Q0BP85_9GAMM|nr:poly-beta-1,6-N-acetyl-D-glucosamine biosynthesis protein PgaD [Candidatus Methylospira mobilis]QFY43887.1 poly-beta-1,6-N-acetyl-D-glucosamine biosynthesis protein PgaD [Candidatus Methylospira mobilis]WNV04890.1 poly-beta-1,6-N-acetyl-D-glucosamine biosynthesis protein PgaD [Candidatus Methylospira mobilis]
MTQLVIESSHLQSSGQRVVAFILMLAGWLMWAYLLFPLLALSCWLLQKNFCAVWVSYSGGYPELRDMLSVYGQTLLALALMWVFWGVYNGVRRELRKRKTKPEAAAALEVKELSRFFGVDRDVLARSRNSAYTTVHFDKDGKLVGLECRE